MQPLEMSGENYTNEYLWPLTSPMGGEIIFEGKRFDLNRRDGIKPEWEWYIGT